MKRLWITAVAGACAVGLTGCAGSGSHSSGGGGGSTGGSLSANMTLLAGKIVSTPAAGSTTNIEIENGDAKVQTINSVYSPDAVNNQNSDLNWVVIRAGSNLLSGHYTGTTAKYFNPSENFTSTIPLTSTGTLAKDTIIPADGEIVLPIDTNVGYSFPNGVTVSFDPGTIDFSVQNNTLAFTVTVPTAGKASANVGQMTFTDSGTSSPQASMRLSFASSDGQSGLTIQTANTNATSPVVAQGSANGSNTVMTTASAFYDLEE